MQIGPYLVEHDSEILNKDKSGKAQVWVAFAGSNPENLSVTMFIEHPQSRSFEEWTVSGKYSIDDASRLGKQAGVEYALDQRQGSFTAFLREDGRKGLKLYSTFEKFFKGKAKKNDKKSKINL